MGQVLAGDSSTKTFSLLNKSVFPVKYEIVLKGKMPENYNSMASFLCTPEEATIQPGETQEVTVACQPDISLPFSHQCEMIVRVPTTNESKSLQYGIHISARVWSRQVFIRTADPMDEPPKGSKDLIVDPFAVPPELCVEPLVSKEESKNDTPERRTIRLTFPKFGLEGNEKSGEKEQNNIKKLLIGACDINSADKSGAGGSFSFREIDSNESSKFFAISPSSGAAKPGEELNVECKFAPPEEANNDTDKVCVIVGQWVEVKYECVLKGGYTPPGMEDEEIVNVHLRGFVVQ
jgi:hypothetical protein